MADYAAVENSALRVENFTPKGALELSLHHFPFAKNVNGMAQPAG
jgi:hypothetical protein